MKCQTCGEPIPPKEKGVAGRMKRYCRKECTPQYLKLKHAGLSNCQVCGKPLEDVGTKGRPKRNCSDRCRDLYSQKIRADKKMIIKQCKYCTKEFRLSRDKRLYCSHQCQRFFNIEVSKAKAKARTLAKYPDGTRTSPCGWCGEERTFRIGESVVNAYHPVCTKEAERARYRIKTVKRQSKLTKPSRLAADEVVRTYGANCHICQQPIDPSLPRTSKLGLTVDHVIPLSKGGLDTIDNLRPAHWACNNRKSNKLPEEINA